jgi:hypothetical protein
LPRLHLACCPLWMDDYARCTCPRLWRIERSRERGGLWLVLRWVDAEARYDLLVRAPTHATALSLVLALIAFDRGFAGEGLTRRLHR